MLSPRKTKHKKMQKGRGEGIVACRKTEISFGSFGLKSLESRWITIRQVEAARKAITHFFQRGGKIWIRIFPDKPITIKGSETGMGGGKGTVDHYVAVVKPGMILFEVDGVSEELAREAFRLASHKLPVKTKFIIKH